MIFRGRGMPTEITSVRAHPRYIDLRARLWEMLKLEQDDRISAEANA